MTDIELAAVIAGAVASIRSRFPKLDGEMVPVLVVLLALVVCILAAPLSQWQASLGRAVRVAVQAVTGVSITAYLAKKASTVTLVDMREAPTRSERGSIRPA
jgi:hypothetical protein